MSFNKTIIISVIMLLGVLASRYIENSEQTKLIVPFAEFPMHIGKWIGQVEYFDDDIYNYLGVNDSLLCNYRDNDGHYMQLYIGFYRSQREGQLIHSPKNCMPGSGWNIISNSLEDLNLQRETLKNKKVIKLILQKGIEKQVVLYWFHSRGRVINSEYLQKIYLVWDSITRNRTDGSFVRIISPVYNDDEDETLSYIRDFSRTIFPIIDRHIPS